MTRDEHIEKVISIINESNSVEESIDKIRIHCDIINSGSIGISIPMWWFNKKSLHMNGKTPFDLSAYLTDSYFIDKKLKSIL